MNPVKRFVRDLGLKLFRACGTTIVDATTGAPIGRAFLFCWRGQVKVIGLDALVRPIFLPQERLTYWKQELGFTAYPRPDFPHIGKGP